MDKTSPVKTINLTLSFLLELCLIVALGYWGFHAVRSEAGKWALGIGMPLIAISLWSIVAAPRSARRLQHTPLAIFKIVIFTLAAVGLYLTHVKMLGVTFELVSLLNIVGSFIWEP